MIEPQFVFLGFLAIMFLIWIAGHIHIHWVYLFYDREWDKRLREALDNNTVEPIGAHLARVGNYMIWTANYPYAYATLNNDMSGVPSPATRRRVRRAVMDAD